MPLTAQIVRLRSRFAANGVSGGCQRMTTVVPALASNSSVDDSPICTNLTYPQAILDVAAYDHTGNLYVPKLLRCAHYSKDINRSQYGWVDQV